MGKILKSFSLAAVLVAVSLSLAACGSSKGIKEENDWNDNLSSYQRMRETAHSTLVSFNDEESAKKVDISESGRYLSLNGEWNFNIFSNNGAVPADITSKKYAGSWDTINVPGNWELQGFDVPMYTNNDTYPWKDLTSAKVSDSYAPVGIYKKEIDVPKDWDGQEIFINFEGVQSAFYVYVNNVAIGYAEDSYNTNEFRLTSYIKPGEKNTIMVKVYKFADASWIEAQDSMKLGGIYRDVYMFSSPKERIYDIQIEPSLDDEYKDGLLQITIDSANYDSSPKNGAKLSVAVYDQDGNEYIPEKQLGKEFSYSTDKTNGASMASARGSFALTDPKLWSAETPNLYTAVIKLKDADGNVKDIVSQKFGVRVTTFEADDNGHQTLLLNGKPITFYGVNYNEHSADTGAALSKEDMINDIKLMKQLNINAVRSPGRPLSSQFLSLCDEYGLYVVDDINLVSTPSAGTGETSIPGDQTIWQTLALDRLMNLFERDKNNASIIMWSLGSQSGTGKTFENLKIQLQNTDKNRLVIYDGDPEVSELVTSMNWEFSEISKYLEGSDAKKPVIIENTKLSLLNGAGGLNTYTDLFANNDRVQGGFLGNWIDYAIYYPTSSEDKRDAYKNSPRSSSPDTYQLTYGGSWGDSITSGYTGLSGILNADRTLQSDADEYKRAYSPVYIEASDLKNGKFTAQNRHDFINYQDNYTIEYTIYAGTSEVSKGTVDGLQINPGEKAEFTVDYGALSANTEYFIDFTVKYKTAPVWAGEGSSVVSASQFDITEFASMPKTGDTNTSGSAYDVSMFVKPDVYTTAIDVSNGVFYFTNESMNDLNSLFTLSYEVYENNAESEYMKADTKEVWRSPGNILYTSGDVSGFSVPGKSSGVKITVPYSVNGVSTGTYQVILTLTATKDYGDLKAGSKFRYVYNKSTLGSEIPFAMDEARTPQPVLGDNGQPLKDDKTFLPIKTGGDPVNSGAEAVEPDTSSAKVDSFVSISNDKTTIIINADTGLIVQYTVDGKDILSNSKKNKTTASPVGNLYRQPTGGDLTSEVTSADNAKKMLEVSQTDSNKILPSGVEVTNVSADHLKLTMNYLLASYPYDNFRNYSLDTDYSVTYDIYGNGEVVVGVAYAPSLFTGDIPFEISNILTLPGDYSNVSWYGRGPGESYSDKVGASRVSVYKNVKLDDQINDYLYPTTNSQKSEVRWASFKDASGNGVMISSDTNMFSMDVSKWYPWDTATYTGELMSKNNTVVRVIGASRGVNAGNVSDSKYYSDPSIVDPGKSYSFTYKLTPITSSVNEETKAQEKIAGTVVPSRNDVNITSGNVYALQNSADAKQYLTSTSEGVKLATGLGDASQIWIKETSTDVSLSGAFRLKNAATGEYLTPVAGKAAFTTIELGLGAYVSGNIWQNFTADSSNEISAAQLNMSIHAVDISGQYYMGSRVALLPKRGKTNACWIMHPVDGAKDQYLLENTASGYYLSVIDSLTYRTPAVASLADRMRKYSPDIDWTIHDDFASASPITAASSTWVPTTKSVTQWQLLPNNSQRWQFVAAADGQYQIINSANSKALAIVDGKLAEADKSSDVSQMWTVNKDGGLVSFVNKSTGLALGIVTEKVKMTEQEMNLNHITDETKAYFTYIVLDVSEYNASPSQLWNMASADDLKINIQAGDKWFDVKISEEEE